MEETPSGRKIIHIDMDCFFAAVEARERPELRGRPVAVGGSPEGRGVVATCSYEARRYGIHSAMPMATALRRCPALVVLPVRMALYKGVSREIQAIFREYTDLVEPLSLDEAFLDVSASPRCRGSATLMASEIRRRIFDTQGLTASAGIAPNKFLAKVASDWNKPDGQMLVTPEGIEGFVRDLPVDRIFGVGRVTARRMAAMGITTCADLQRLSRAELVERFGSFGPRLYQLSRGIDHRPVTPHRVRKSLSVEDTFAVDLPNLSACQAEIPRLVEALRRRLEQARAQQSLVPKALFIKLRFNDFATTTLQGAGGEPHPAAYHALCARAWQRGRRPVRLIGVGIQFQPPGQPEQLQLTLESG